MKSQLSSQKAPALSLKLAPSTFILLGNFVTLHFGTAYIFPPCCIILKKKEERKKKKTGGSAEEGEERELEGKKWVGRVTVTRQPILGPESYSTPSCTTSLHKQSFPFSLRRKQHS